MWIVCKDKLVNSDRLEAICIQADKEGTHIIGYVANDPYDDTHYVMGTYESHKIAAVKCQMLICALEENRNVFRMP